MGWLACCQAGARAWGSRCWQQKQSIWLLVPTCTCLSGTLTEQLGLYFCIQIRGTLSCLEEVQEQGGEILGGKVLGPVLGVSPCRTGPRTQTSLLESQCSSVPRACAKILMLHPQYNMPCHGCICPQ